MNLRNETPLEIALVRSSEPTDEVIVLVVCALTCRVGDGAPLVLAPRQRPLRLVDDTAETGEVADGHFLRVGVHVCAHGFVHPLEPGGAEGLATLRVGEIERHVAAFGTRVWSQGAFGLAPSPPLPFERVAMSWDNAYGGHVRNPTTFLEHEGEEVIVPEHPVAHVLNPGGKGFFVTEQQAKGSPLPQLESPNQRIKAWDDRPEPACFAPYPVWGGMRARAVFDGRDGKVDLARTPTLFSRAAPPQVFEDLPAGARVTLGGMLPGRERLSLTVPPPPVRASCRIGDEVTDLSMRLDAIDLFAEEREARFVYRAKHVYPLVQYELREMVCEGTPVLDAMIPRGIG